MVEQLRARRAARASCSGATSAPRWRARRSDRGGALESTLVRATAMFVDLRGFTSHRAAHAGAGRRPHAERVLRAPWSACASARAASITQFLGDGVVVVFGGPLRPADDHARRAVRAAIALQWSLVNHPRAGRHRTVAGRASASAPATWWPGNIRANERVVYTIVGDAVNQAARLQVKTRDLGTAILLTAEHAGRARRRGRLLPAPGRRACRCAGSRRRWRCSRSRCDAARGRKAGQTLGERASSPAMVRGRFAVVWRSCSSRRSGPRRHGVPSGAASRRSRRRGRRLFARFAGEPRIVRARARVAARARPASTAPRTRATSRQQAGATADAGARRFGEHAVPTPRSPRSAPAGGVRRDRRRWPSLGDVSCARATAAEAEDAARASPMPRAVPCRARRAGARRIVSLEVAARRRSSPACGSPPAVQERVRRHGPWPPAWRDVRHRAGHPASDRAPAYPRAGRDRRRLQCGAPCRATALRRDRATSAASGERPGGLPARAGATRAADESDRDGVSVTPASAATPATRVEQRIDELSAEMTLAEKLDQMHGSRLRDRRLAHAGRRAARHSRLRDARRPARRERLAGATRPRSRWRRHAERPGTRRSRSASARRSARRRAPRGRACCSPRR